MLEEETVNLAPENTISGLNNAAAERATNEMASEDLYRLLHADDIVVRKSNRSKWGAVERTNVDVDTHAPSPMRSEYGPILRHKRVQEPAFKAFLQHGIPPKDTVLVRWQESDQAELIPESELVLFDRSFLIGDVVRRSLRDATSGIVINTFTKCTLQPVGDLTYNNKSSLKGILPKTGIEIPIQISSSGSPTPLVEIPAEELEETSSPNEGDIAIYRDWIGQVGPVVCTLTLKLVDDSVVEILDELAKHVDGATEYFQIGDIATATKGAVRMGRWIYGEYNANTPPVGTVVDSRVTAASMIWLQRRIGSSEEREPPEYLERDDLESAEFRVYDRTRRPRNVAATARRTVSNSEMDIHLTGGMRLRFKDLTAACVKYDGSSKYGKIARIDRKDTLGYDLNVFQILRFTTEVDIEWQDLSITRERSIDLIPDPSIDDEHAAWPGEIAHSLDLSIVDGMVAVKAPARTGVVQTVNASERMAKIRWCPNACLQYSLDESDKESVRTLTTGVVGIAAGDEELVSLYEVEAPAELNVRRGDIVLVAKNDRDLSSSGIQRQDVNWVGEIVDTCLDGTLTIRLGASTDVRDVTLRREEIIVAIRSDGADEMEEWTEEDMEAVMDTHDILSMDSTDEPEWDNWNEDWSYPGSRWRRSSDPIDASDYLEEFEDETEDEPVARYEDEEGNSMDEDEVEDEEWESDDGEHGDDVMMLDDTATESRLTQDVDTEQNRMIENNHLVDESSDVPPPYLILEGDIPQSHRFASEKSSESTTWMKRMQKEHKILRSPGALPKGVYVRTWESRMDLLRVLFIGPADTPYADAPFIIDFCLPQTFPTEPPQAFFHSWQSEGGLGGVGRVNPNLYEDGKICLSLLGTWAGNKGEGWSASRSTLLQVIVSLLGLVLVREPYFNEAGYEPLAEQEGYKRPSTIYSERILLRSKTFVICALNRVSVDGGSGGVEGLDGVLRWLYKDQEGPQLLQKTIDQVEKVLQRSEDGGEPDGLTVLSKGACIPLRRVLERLNTL